VPPSSRAETAAKLGKGGQFFSQMTTIRRKSKAESRIIRRALAEKSAAEAIGPLSPGCEIYGLTKGQFSLIDLIEHLLSFTGPCRAVISTWTAAGADIGFAYRLMSGGKLTALRFLVDFSFPSRQPAYCAALRETFGDGCIRISKNHAKFVLLRNDTWNVVVRTSMNLNENRRLENFEISDDANLANFLEGVIDEIFEAQSASGQLEKRPIDHMDFERLGGEEAKPRDDLVKSTDARKFYNDGPFENDLRRVGVSYLR
jgi:hypothetical protein